MRTRRQLRIEQLDGRYLTASFAATDVNQSGDTTTLDALVIMNGFIVDEATNLWVPQEEPYWDDLGFKPDVSGNGIVSTLDALLVINHLSILEAEAEGVDAVFDNVSFLDDED